MRRVGTDARPEAESATSGVVWRGRSIRAGVFASFPLGAGGSRPRVDGAPRPPGSVRSGRTPGASAKQDPWSGGPRVRVPCSRVLIACQGGTPGCGVRSDRARGSGTQAHPVDGRGRERDRHVRRRDPAPHRIGEGGFDCLGDLRERGPRCAITTSRWPRISSTGRSKPPHRISAGSGTRPSLSSASSSKLSLAVVLDLFSRFVVGWAVRAVHDRHLTIKALEMALKRRCPEIGEIIPESCIHLCEEPTFDLLNDCVDRVVRDRVFDPNSYRAGEVHGDDLPKLIRALLFVAIEGEAPGAARFANGEWSQIGIVMPIVTRLVIRTGWSPYVIQKFLTLCERAGNAYPLDAFAAQGTAVLGSIANAKGSWTGTVLPARTAATVQRLADANFPLGADQAQELLTVLDALIELGDRRSVALEQSEAFRGVQLQ